MSPTPKAVVLGAGGHARAVISAVRLVGQYEIVAVLDRQTPKPNETIFDIPVVGEWSAIQNFRDVKVCAVFAASGDGGTREEMLEFCSSLDLDTPKLVHPAAFIDPTAQIGPGTVILAGAIVGPEAKIGRGVVLNTKTSVDHESSIGDFTTVCPGVTIAGRSNIGTNVFIGIGACVSDNRVVEDNARIGAGSIVLHDIASGEFVVGTPARPKRAAN